MWTNDREIASNGLDDDGNGFVDDNHGWNSAYYNNDPIDDHFHGTQVSGTIAALGNNGHGIIGVAPRAKIMPVKAFDDRGHGWFDQVAAAVAYAASNGADVMNNSWGCGTPCPSNPVIEDAVRLANGLGVVTVFSAGNNSGDVRVRSPQNMHDPKPLVVAASTQEDVPAFFTSYGATVDVTAPGAGNLPVSNMYNILSLKSAACKICPSKYTIDSKYLLAAGTSMAAPHASGLAALILSHRPDLTNNQVRQVMRASADDLELPGFDPKTGAGRLNARQALAIGSVPDVWIDEPLHGATQGPGSAVVIQGTASGPGFDHYQLFYRALGVSEWTPIGNPVDTPVQGGPLGTWQLRSPPLGWALLRLAVATKNGRAFDDVLDLGIQIPAKTVPADIPGSSAIQTCLGS